MYCFVFVLHVVRHEHGSHDITSCTVACRSLQAYIRAYKLMYMDENTMFVIADIASRNQREQE